MLICLNGEYVAPDEAKVSIWDRGFIFGDAVYEVCRLYGGRAWIEERHLARLERSLKAVRIEGVDMAALRKRMGEAIARSGIGEGTIYIQITRGAAPRKHAFPRPPIRPTELIVVAPYDDGPTARLREEGIGVVTQPDLRWGHCDIKSTNLLANVLANEAAQASGGYEAVLIDREGHVTEATHSSLLWVRAGRLGGSPETPAILPGTTRSAVLEVARDEGLEFRVERITLPTLLASEEVILAGTTIEVLPVVRVDDAAIGHGVVGPVARRLQAGLGRRIERWRDDRREPAVP